VQYVHDEVGVNSRLDSIQAAILKVKLKELDKYAAARNQLADFYDAAFANHSKIKTPTRAKHSDHVFHQYTLTLNGVDRDGLRQFLADNDIPAMIYYPIPLHKQKAYQDPRYKDGDFPVTESLCPHVISLPMHTEMQDNQRAHIVAKVLEYVK
jgi:UDP-2-acetamido-2-deoxy-ribo-hexuluronate aminotransferase